LLTNATHLAVLATGYCQISVKWLTGFMFRVWNKRKTPRKNGGFIGCARQDSNLRPAD
jgi:hypothetical protein